MSLPKVILYVFCSLWVNNALLCQSQAPAVVPDSTWLNKPISYTCVELPIGQVLRELSDSFNLKFTYINNEIPVAELRSINCSPCSLKGILDGLFPSGNIAYVPILSQILLKAQNKKLVSDTTADTLEPNHIGNQDSILVDSIEVVVIKRGIVTKRWRQIRPMALKGNLHLDHLAAIYDYDTTYSFVYDTLTSDTLKAQKRTQVITSMSSHSALSKRHPSSITNGDYVSFALGIGHAYRILEGMAIGHESVGMGQALTAFNVRQRKESLEHGRRNYLLSIMYQRGFGKHFFVKVGANYMSFGEEGSYDASLMAISRPRGAGPPTGPPGRVLIHDTTISYENEYRYLGLPLGLGFTFGKKLGFSLVPTIVLNLLAGKKIRYPQENYVAQKPRHLLSPDSSYEFSQEVAYYYNPHLDARKNEYRTLAIFFQADVEFFYRIADRYRVFVAPTFCYSLTSIYKASEALSHRPYSYGLKMGVSYLLNP